MTTPIPWKASCSWTRCERACGSKACCRSSSKRPRPRSIEEWCAIGRGTRRSDVVEIAKEFTSHGKKAVADLHRGVSQHTGGFYNVCAWYTVNALIGNTGWQGGLCKATTYNYTGNRPGKPFDMTKQYKGGIKAWGVNIIRHSAVYDKTTLFEGFPAKRTWYPFATDIYQEVIPSIGDMYPYQIKALLLYMGAPNYSLPSGHTLASRS
jgi:tetrathionate reductase subunit A